MQNDWTEKIHCGDALAVLGQMPDKMVQCIVTSPPYYGLRQYLPNLVKLKDDAPEWVIKRIESLGVKSFEIPEDMLQYFEPAEIGLEQTTDKYVASLVAVFREARRVLSDDGVLWLNLGDSYASNGTGGNGATGGRDKSTLASKMPPIGTTPVKKVVLPGLKPKNLIGIPWMVAFALRADGWYLRQEIIWHKPNPMPESVKDRCVKSHEQIFLLSKSERYYFDYKAIQEPVKADWGTRNRSAGKYHNDGSGLQPHSGLEKSYDMANKRSVWTVPTAPYKNAHFAAFPPNLIRPCILAGSREGDIVMDPFAGSGTTWQVCLQHDRNFVGIELNPKYIDLAEERVRPYRNSLFKI